MLWPTDQLGIGHDMMNDNDDERKSKESNECNVHGSTHTERWFIHIDYSLVFDSLKFLCFMQFRRALHTQYIISYWYPLGDLPYLL